MAGLDKRIYKTCQPLKDMAGWVKGKIYTIGIVQLFNGRFAIFSFSTKKECDGNYRVYNNIDDICKDFVLNP